MKIIKKKDKGDSRKKNQSAISAKTTKIINSIKSKDFLKSKKLLISVLCVLVSIIILLVVAINLVNNRIDDSYFVSDENKDVITLEVSDPSTTNLVRTHIVYTYANDQISSLKTYYEYENNDQSTQALENTKLINPDAESVDVDGKYIVVTASPNQYTGLTPSDVKQHAEAIRGFQESQKNKDKKE